MHKMLISINGNTNTKFHPISKGNLKKHCFTTPSRVLVKHTRGELKKWPSEKINFHHRKRSAVMDAGHISDRV